MSAAPTEIQKVLPHCTETEKAILSIFLQQSQSAGAACAEAGVTPAWFYVGHHGLIFNALFDLWQKGAKFDFATVAARVYENDPLSDPRYVNDLTALPVDSGALPAHLDTLRARYQLRALNGACVDAARDTMATGADPEAALAGLMDKVGALACAKAKGAPTMPELVRDKFRRMQANEPDTNIIKTGLSKLDHHSPLRLGSMPLVSGERKAGKSMLAMNIAVNIALKKVPGMYFTLEMPATELIDRMYAKAAGIPTTQHKIDGLTGDQCSKMESTAEALATMPMVIRDDLFDLGKIVAAIRQQKAQQPALAVVFVDYVQLVRVSLGKGVNREQEVAHVSRTFRLLSMELKLATVLLCQLNKDGETRESKALEQDCTAMWKLSSPTEKEPNERVLYIPFQRGGQSNIAFKLTYLGDVCRVFDFSGRDEPS